jgi:hypothetical protein
MVMSDEFHVPATLPQATKGTEHKITKYIINKHNIIKRNKTYKSNIINILFIPDQGRWTRYHHYYIRQKKKLN